MPSRLLVSTIALCGVLSTACTSKPPTHTDAPPTADATVWQGLRIQLPQGWIATSEAGRFTAHIVQGPSRCPTTRFIVDYVDPDQFKETQTSQTHGTRCLETAFYTVRSVQQGKLRIQCFVYGSGEGTQPDPSICSKAIASIQDSPNPPTSPAPQTQSAWHIQHAPQSQKPNTVEYFDPQRGFWSRGTVQARVELVALPSTHRRKPTLFLQTEQHWSGARVIVLRPRGRAYVPVWDDYTFALAVGPQHDSARTPDLIAYQDNGQEEGQRNVLCNRFAWDENTRAYTPSFAQCPKPNTPEWTQIGPF